MTEPYFEDLPYIGTLYLQTTYLFFEEPLLFLCVDAQGHKFLCLCSEFRDEYRWIITETDKFALRKMITNELPTYEVFHNALGKKYIVQWSGYESDHESVLSVTFDAIPALDLPEKNVFLDILPAQQQEFLKDLQKLKFNFKESKYCTWTIKYCTWTMNIGKQLNVHLANDQKSSLINSTQNWTIAKRGVGL